MTRRDWFSSILGLSGVAAVQHIPEPQAGDLVVVKCHHTMSLEDADLAAVRIGRYVKPGVKVLIVDNSADVVVHRGVGRIEDAR